MKRVLSDSRVVKTLRSVSDAVERGVTGSRLLQAVSRAGDRAGETLGRWVRDSWLFGPPADPEVIVIDLRETYTVGPAIRVLDRIAAWVGPRWHDSRPQRALDRAEETVADHPVRALSTLLFGLAVGSLLATLVQGAAISGWQLLLAGLALLGTRETRSAGELRETWVGQALVALFVPPEEPNRE